MSRKRKRSWLIVLGGTTLVCVLAACTLSVHGGVIGGIVALLLAGGVLFSASVVETGCQPCLSPRPSDGSLLDRAPEAEIGACLKLAPPDAAGDAPVGVCLQPLPLDAGVDGDVGPCLKVIAPDAGFDAGQASAVPSPAPHAASNRARHAERRALLDALEAEGRLPADVLVRLRQGHGRS